MFTVGDYTKGDFPKNREIMIDALDVSKYYNHIVGLFDLDVTDAMRVFDAYKDEGKPLSFTSWIMKCIAQAVSEHKEIQTLRYGKKKIVTFENVDIKCMVEKDDAEGNKIPIHHIIRKANEKTFLEIQEEIRVAQKYKEERRSGEKRIKKKQGTIMSFPKFIRNIIWHTVMTNPFKVKKHLCTIGVSALGMFGKGMRGWAIPKTPHSTQFLLGSVVKMPVVTDDDQIIIRRILNVTVSFNHDIVDGGPAVRFVGRLQELTNEAFQLEDLMKK